MPAPRECEWLPWRQAPLLAAMYSRHAVAGFSLYIPVHCMVSVST